MKLDTGWAEDALCHGSALEIFFDPSMSAVAIATCRRCPVLEACRDWTDATEGRTPLNGLAGVFGAETPRQRYRRRREARREIELPAA